MCGFAGLWDGSNLKATGDAVAGMISRLEHRGPDAEGVWSGDDQSVSLGHRRLSILDLSPNGAQPMRSVCGRWVLAFNGEIYNHLELRHELERDAAAPVWRGHSDTETLLAAIAHWGLDGTLRRCVGMFAIALWDRANRRLSLARDRFGEKPLYWGLVDGALAFASELKALRALPGFRGEIDRDALGMYIAHAYVPTPFSIYKGVSKAEAGTCLEFSSPTAPPQRRVYWSALEAARAGLAEPLRFESPDGAESALERVLSASIQGQMLSDVPLGAFLSGGVDSSTVVALMQASSARRVQTFCIGFEESAYDESGYAEAVARHLGTEHTTLRVAPEDAIDVIPMLPKIYDEPFADASQIPTFLVSRLAKQRVTVALSGDGGDEVFGGYNRYTVASRAWRRLDRFPVGVRRLAASALLRVSPADWDDLATKLGRLLPERWRYSSAGDKVHKAAGLLDAKDEADLYRHLVSFWPPRSVVLGDAGRQMPGLAMMGQLNASLEERMMLTDASTYLGDDILVKLDRAAMANSLETRAPFLDHRVFEFAWRLPLVDRVANGEGKRLLRRVLYRHVPPSLVERPKMGFGIPIHAWLRGPLREWAESLLQPQQLREQGYFDEALVQRCWREHQSGSRNWQYHLWPILMFQAWLHEQDR